MHSTPADSAIERLLTGESLSSGKIVVGPLSADGTRLLRILWDNRAELTKKKGFEQISTLRSAYVCARDAYANEVDNPGAGSATIRVPEATSAETPITSISPWRLHHLRCESIRGIAPFGTIFEFAFDSESTFIYGPNGSGKSSLLNAVRWVLTGQVVTDCDNDSEIVSLYAPPTPNGKIPKLCDWPVEVTLPGGAVSAKTTPNCWAELHLRSKDGSKDLYLRRSLLGGFEQSADGKDWQACEPLSTHGITPLDIHLSVSAATVFGRKSLESSESTRHLLSMMLGYDALEELGAFVTSLATNLTKTVNSDREQLTSRKQALRNRLSALPLQLRDDLAVRSIVGSLAEDPSAHPQKIIAASTAVTLVLADAGKGSVCGCRTQRDELFDSNQVRCRALRRI